MKRLRLFLTAFMVLALCATAKADINFVGGGGGGGGGSNGLSSGTWTPTIAGDGTAGTGTYNFQSGNYLKYTVSGGQTWVTVSFYVQWATFSGATGNLIIPSLPFAAISSSTQFFDSNVGSFQGLTLTTGYTAVGTQIGNGATSLSIVQSGSAQTTATVPISGVAGAGQMVGTITYRIS